MASTSTRLTIFCLISGERISRAFSVEVPSDWTIDKLKDSIKAKQSPTFDDITANSLELWRVTLRVDENTGDEGVIKLDALHDKTKLNNPRTHLSKLFSESPDDNTYIVVECPKATSTPHTLELEAKMAEMLMEIEELRGGKNIITLNVVVRPNRNEDAETTTIKELERAIYAAYPGREDGEVVLAVIHVHGTPQHEAGGTEHPSDDAQFRKTIQQYRKTNTRTISVALETPTKKYGDFTLNEVNRLYEITSTEAPGISDLPSFDDISTEALDSDQHKESLRRLLDEIDTRMQVLPSRDYNEATCSVYVCSFLAQAVRIFGSELALVPERPLRGRHGHGKVDYAIESLAKDGMRHVLGVTEVKQEDYRKA
ncbi:hypothetical protein BGZ49_003152 [Haplosporangium sp. Z 27]|nr:hypothetical protein BGZ49_003152 [Haplosporangium sp. Z 27]